MFIYYFAPSNSSLPSTKYRGVYLLDHLKKNYSVNFKIFYPDKVKNYFHIIVLIVKTIFLKKSIFIFQKICTPTKYSYLLKILLFLNKKKSIYDLDDAMWKLKNKQVVNYFIKNCNLVFAGSREIKKYCQSLNKNTALITTPIINHNIIKREKNKVINIGWIGFFSVHKDSLFKILFPVLSTIDFPVKLSLLGVQNRKDLDKIKDFLKNKNIIKNYIPLSVNWNNELNIYKKIADFDIGVFPLLNTTINRCKSSFKLKQYMSCGIPVLASDIGENKYFIKKGKNGFLFTNKKQLKNYLTLFNKMNDQKYLTFSKTARKTYQHFFNINVVAKKYFKNLKNL